MDEIDIELIKLLQENSRISITELSRRVSLSRPSVKERIDRLVEKGVIESFTVIVDPEKIGREIIFYIQLSDLSIPYSTFESMLGDIEAVTEVYRVTGYNNYIIKASTKDIEEMNILLEELIKYGKIETSIVIDSILKRKVLLPE